MIPLRPDEVSVLAKYIHSVTGIALDATKSYLVENRLSGLVQEFGCANYSELYFKARTDASGVLERRVIDAITTGETLFFRDSAPFELLRHKLIPDLVDARTRSANGNGTIPIRIWSAACSSGQEIYSIGIALKETLTGIDRFDIRLVGTDIADKAVAAASRGVFGRVEIERGLPPATLQRWFTPQDGGWKIHDEIRGMATFRRMNLMEDVSTLGKFDIVFCRNVAIYFNEADRASVFSRIGRTLEPDGFLVIGSTESLSGICPQFEPKRHLRSVYYQHRGAAASASVPGRGSSVSAPPSAPMAPPFGSPVATNLPPRPSPLPSAVRPSGIAPLAAGRPIAARSPSGISRPLAPRPAGAPPPSGLLRSGTAPMPARTLPPARTSTGAGTTSGPSPLPARAPLSTPGQPPPAPGSPASTRIVPFPSDRSFQNMLESKDVQDSLARLRARQKKAA